MKIKVCEDGLFWDNIYESDRYSAQHHENLTYLSDYSKPFVEMDVTLDELVKLVNKGASIKINC